MVVLDNMTDIAYGTTDFADALVLPDMRSHCVQR